MSDESRKAYVRLRSGGAPGSVASAPGVGASPAAGGAMQLGQTFRPRHLAQSGSLPMQYGQPPRSRQLWQSPAEEAGSLVIDVPSSIVGQRILTTQTDVG